MYEPSEFLFTVCWKKETQMSKAKQRFLSTPALAACAIASMLVLGNQLVVWATSACQVPNPNTKFCTSAQTTYTCSGSESTCTLLYDAFERNQFPDGGAESASGTTKEEAADCWRRKYCVWNDETRKCVSSTTWGGYQSGDKTVVGDNTCPTDEG